MDKRISTTVAPSMWDTFNFSYQIADGMEFLSSKGVLHRDLACRNILVGEDKVLKITDFGLSRETEKYMKTSHSRVPFKWMPLEFLQTGEFTYASDVWSYGIVLWEIATFGELICIQVLYSVLTFILVFNISPFCLKVLLTVISTYSTVVEFSTN